MKGHGLHGKISTSFTTFGKPCVTNLQYNCSFKIYDDHTVDEMVKIMDTKTGITSTNGDSSFKMTQQTTGNIVSRIGWIVNRFK